jgi:bifunctional non-homologous end joining protein LigD
VSPKKKLPIRAGRRTVEVSSPDKLLFPDAGITKADLASYYRDVAPAMVPHVRGRPLNMQRYPDGIEGEGWLQQKASDHFPDWIERVTVRKSGGSVPHVVANDAATLVYLANQASITQHVWLSRVDRLDRPDRVVVDLDPPGEDFDAVRQAAREITDLLVEIGLTSFPMVTGSKGIHLWVPLRRSTEFDEVRDFARDFARVAADRDPERLTVEFRKAKRGGRILVDVNRNAYAQTAVAPYSVRAKPGAPVATPITHEELADSRLSPRRWDLRAALQRVERNGDPWKDINRKAPSLGGPRKRLAELAAE